MASLSSEGNFVPNPPNLLERKSSSVVKTPKKEDIKENFQELNKFYSIKKIQKSSKKSIFGIKNKNEYEMKFSKDIKYSRKRSSFFKRGINLNILKKPNIFEGKFFMISNQLSLVKRFVQKLRMLLGIRNPQFLTKIHCKIIG